MIRPQALQLQLDDNYAPVQLETKTESLWTWLYQFQWRKIVIVVSALDALRFFVSASNAFQDVNIDKTQHLSRLASISTALGAIYSTSAVINIFGVFSASMQRQYLVRVYAHLAFISALLVTVAGFIAGVSYFVLSNDLIQQCITLCTKGLPRSRYMFRGALWPKSILTPAAAQDVCLKAWASESSPQIFSIILFSLIPSIVYLLLVYTYYRQTTDPSHPAYVNPRSSPRGSAIRMEELPEARYSPLYNGHSPPYSDDITDALRVRTPRNGNGQTSKGKGRAKGKTSGSWSGKGRSKGLPRLKLSPIMHTASPYMITPGPPSFSTGIGGLSKDFRPAFFRVGSDV